MSKLSFLDGPRERWANLSVWWHRLALLALIAFPLVSDDAFVDAGEWVVEL